MPELTITGPTVTLIAVSQAQVDALKAQIIAMEQQRRQIAQAVEDQIRAEAKAQGTELPRDFSANVQDDAITVTWPEEMPEL